MESSSLPSHVQVSEETFHLLPDPLKALFEERLVQLKGKGTMRTFLLNVPKHKAVLGSMGVDLTNASARNS